MYALNKGNYDNSVQIYTDFKEPTIENRMRDLLIRFFLSIVQHKLPTTLLVD